MDELKREYYNLKENLSIMRNFAKMVDNVSEILKMYPNIKDMSLKEVKEYLIDKYSKFDIDSFNKFNELITNKQNITKEQEELIKTYIENKLA